VVSSRKFQIPTGAAPVAGTLLAGLLAEFFLLSAGERAITAFVTLTATIAELLLRAAGNLHSSVVVVPVALLNVGGIAGYLYYPSISTSAVSAVILDSPAIYQSAARAFVVAGLAFTAGAAIVLCSASRKRSESSLAGARDLNLRPHPYARRWPIVLVALDLWKGSCTGPLVLLSSVRRGLGGR
jgi:hypothetical protein